MWDHTLWGVRCRPYQFFFNLIAKGCWVMPDRSSTMEKMQLVADQCFAAQKLHVRKLFLRETIWEVFVRAVQFSDWQRRSSRKFFSVSVCSSASFQIGAFFCQGENHLVSQKWSSGVKLGSLLPLFKKGMACPKIQAVLGRSNFDISTFFTE